MNRLPLAKILCLLLIWYSPLLEAQSYGWSFGFGNEESDSEARITLDEHSNIYATGSFKGTVDFDPGAGTTSLSSGGAGTLINTYITKYDSTGMLVWAKQLIGDVQQYGRDIVYDQAGYIYIFGYYIGTCDFDPGPGQHNLTSPNFTYDSFILKLDVDGNFIWVIPVGGNGNEYANRITIDPDGNLIVGGIFTGTTDFDPGPNQAIFSVTGLVDMFIVKYTSAGEFVWANHTAGGFNSAIGGIDTDPEGNIYIAGAFDDYRDFNPEGDSVILQATGLWDIYVLKLNAAGNLLWVKHLGNDDDNWAHDIAYDKNGFLYVTGYFSGALDFDPGPESDVHAAVLRDVFVWKLDDTGEHIWVKPAGGISYEQGKAIALDRNGDVYITGYYAETVDFDPGPDVYLLTSTGDNDENDAFALKLHSDGSFVWAHTMGGLAEEFGYGVEIGAVDDIFLTGTFNSVSGFNPGSGVSDSLTSNGIGDVYIVRWLQCLNTYDTIVLFSCQPVTSLSGHFIWTESGTYLDTIKNAAGCDSIITIDLLISDLGLSVTQSGNMLLGDGGASQFLWIDCDHQNETVGEGSVFAPVADGNFALVGVGFACTDTSECFSFVLTAVEDISLYAEPTIFPNPAHQSFQIDLGSIRHNIIVYISDPLGRNIWSNQYTETERLTISPDVPPGLYFISLAVDDKMVIQKIILE